jgi:hypothetical protein
MDKHGFSASGQDDTGMSRMVFSPSTRHMIQAKKLTTTIKKMKTDLGNMTVYNKKSGLLNLRKAMINEESNKFNDFKRFVPSRLNKTKMLVSVLVDSSGSMTDTQYDLALSSAYSISKALENTNSMSKIYEFSTNFNVLKRFDQGVDKSPLGRNYCDGTHVLSALHDTTKSMQATAKKYGIHGKIVIIITDGNFDQMEETAEYVRYMRKLGIYVCVFKVTRQSTYGWYHDRLKHYKDSYNKITIVKDFEALNESMLEIVDHIQKKIVIEVKQNERY